MKLKQFTKIVAIGSFGSALCFLASCKDTDQETSDQTNEPSRQAPAVVINTVPVYIVTVSGTGWGIGDRASSVLTAQPGVQKVKLSGMRATVFLEAGAQPNKEEITKQLEAEGLKLVSAEAGKLSTPVAAYTIQVKGTGWSKTAEKVRVALEKMDVVSSAFVNAKIELYLTKDVVIDEEAVKAAISASGAKFVEMKKEDSISL